MNIRQQLIEDGYLIFPEVIPEVLCRDSAESLNTESRSKGTFFVWQDSVMPVFQMWARSFLEEQQLNLSGWDAAIHVFNRQPGTDAQPWHDDDQATAVGQPFGSCPFRRVFVCSFFVSTFEGRGPLKIIPGSHKGGYGELRSQIYTAFRQGKLAAMYPELWMRHPEQQILEVPAGTVVVVDERMLHAVDINRHPEPRPMALWWLMKDQSDRNQPGG